MRDNRRPLRGGTQPAPASRRRKKKIKIPGFVFVLVFVALGAVTGILLGRALSASGRANPMPLPLPGDASSAASVPQSVPEPDPDNPFAHITPRGYAAMPLPQEMRAMYISFQEWLAVDLASEEAGRAAIRQMFDNSKALGLNTVVVQVRPFGDALYESTVYPWSHVLTGAQGGYPGYDPLAVMVEEAHARGLRIEAWINPYRVRHSVHGPNVMANDNPALLNPDWVRDLEGNEMLDPAIPEVQQLVVDGVLEIVQNYDVDGIHFDDYFYPEFTAAQLEAGADTAFDAEAYAAYEGELSLADWRRENVNTLIRQVYAAVKAANPAVSFGISPQGNNDNNYNTQYSDIRLWLSTAGYADYISPQLYWGFGHVDAAGKDTAAFAKKTDEWAFYPRAEGVHLYAGLGAYRIGTDGGNGAAEDQSEWYSGHNLADQVEHLRGADGFSGFMLFRYGNLYMNEDPLAEQEAQALAALLGAG